MFKWILRSMSGEGDKFCSAKASTLGCTPLWGHRSEPSLAMPKRSPEGACGIWWRAMGQRGLCRVVGKHIRLKHTHMTRHKDPDLLIAASDSAKSSNRGFCGRPPNAFLTQLTTGNTCVIHLLTPARRTSSFLPVYSNHYRSSPMNTNPMSAHLNGHTTKRSPISIALAELDLQNDDEDQTSNTQNTNSSKVADIMNTMFATQPGVPPSLSALSSKCQIDAESIEAFQIDTSGMSESVEVPHLPYIGKPRDDNWFQTLNASKWRMFHVYAPTKDMGRTIYLVTPAIAAELGPVVKKRWLVPTVTLDGVHGYWPIGVGGGKSDAWTESSHLIAGIAQRKWVRMCSDHGVGAYKHTESTIYKPAPVWPDEEEHFKLFCKATEGKLIHSMDHPVVLKLL